MGDLWLFSSLQESLKKIERSGVFFSRASVDPKQRAKRFVTELVSPINEQAYGGLAAAVTVLITLCYLTVVFAL